MADGRPDPETAGDTDTRPPRLPGLAWVGLFLATVLLFTPTALGQEDASARTEPSTAQPGEDVDLVFQIESPDLAEVVVQEEVTCTVTFPDGSERQPCGATAGLAEVRTAGSSAREYVFDYQAPDDPGAYEVAFEADSTARVPSQTYTASTSFNVTEGSPTAQAGGTPETEEPIDDDPAGGDGPGAEDGSDQGGPSSIDPIGGDDASRLMASTTLATGVLAVSAVANRFPLGGPD